METLTLKISCAVKPTQDLRMFSACYRRFIFTIKKNNNLQKPLEREQGESAKLADRTAKHRRLGFCFYITNNQRSLNLL